MADESCEAPESKVPKPSQVSAEEELSQVEENTVESLSAQVCLISHLVGLKLC